MKIFLKAVLNLICMGNMLGGWAQSEIYFEHYSTDKGLSQGSGYCITSYDDYLWFGTQDGINRFDGYKMDVFKTGNSRGLKGNYINTLRSDSQGNLWVGTVNGLCLYDKETQGFKSFFEVFKIKHLIDNQSVSKIVDDQKGTVWIITDENGLYRFDTRTKQIKGYFTLVNNLIAIVISPIDQSVWLISDVELFRFDAAADRFVTVNIRFTERMNPKVILRTIAVDSKNNLWIGTYEHGIYVLPTTGSIKLIRHFQKGDTPKDIRTNEVTSLFCDRSGRMWVGHRRAGISLYLPDKNHFIYSSHAESNPRSIASDYVLFFYEDRQSNIWIGLSGGGIDKYDPLKYRFKTIQKDFKNNKNGLSDNMVFDIYGHRNYLYLGTQTGGLNELNLKTNQYKSYLPDPDNPKSILHSQVYDISTDSTGHLWLATGRGLCVFDPIKQVFASFVQEKNRSPLVYLYAVKVLKNQQEVWAGGERGLLRLDLKNRQWKSWNDRPELTKIAKYIQRIIYEDSTQNIWLGTQGHSLIRYNPFSRKVTVFDKKSGLNCHNIRSFYEEKGSLWVGTDCGLYIIDKKTDRIKNYFSENDERVAFQLPNNVIYGILKDADGFYWLSTNRGLTKFSESRGIIKNFEKRDGLQSDEFNTNCTYLSPDGELYFGGVNGVSYFKTNEIASNTYIPPVKITDIQVLNQAYLPHLKELKLNHNQNFISLQFAAFNFSNTEKNTYQYKLEGINKDWVNAGFKNYANYTNLPPNDYIFRIKGYNDDGLPNPKEAILKITITPPYYQTWWFRLPIILLMIWLVYNFYKTQVITKLLRANLEKESLKGLQKEAELKEKEAAFQQQIAQTEIAALRLQMNPHFIFNCLNSIQLYTAQNNTEKATDYLNKFSRLIRLVLENSRSEKVSLENELETLRLYMEMEAMRFRGKVNFSINIAQNVDKDSIQIPPLLLQPFVENAIWHGLMHKEEGGIIRIEVTQPHVHLLRFDITDDGVGREKAAEFKSKSATQNKSFGMKVTAERIELINQLYNTATQVQIIDLKNKQGEATGTKVVVEIPI